MKSAAILVALSLAAALTLVSNSQGAQITTASYVAYAVEHLARTSGTTSATSNCVVVFYGLDPPENSLDETTLGRIIDELGEVSKLIFNKDVTAENVGDVPAEPTALVLQGDILRLIMDSSSLRRFMCVLKMFSPFSRIFVLTSLFRPQEVMAFELVLKQLKFFYMIFLDEVQHGQIWPKNRKVGGFIAAEWLFQRDYFPDLAGRPIVVLKRRDRSFVDIISGWMIETARLMNTTVEMYNHRCAGGEQDTCYQKILEGESYDVDYAVYHLLETPPRNFQWLTTAITDKEVILVPQSRMSMVQQLTRPLEMEVWIFLAVLIAIAELVHMKYPSLIRNDPFLLVICGHKQYNSNKTRRWEIYMLHSLIILMFFITSAYETLLISWMIQPPSARRIRTISEFVKSGIKIKSNLLANAYLMNNPILANLLINSTESILNMDLIHAHIVSYESALQLLPMYYDPVQKLDRYTILEEPISLTIQSFRFADRSRLLRGFAHSLTDLTEAGIVRFWDRHSRYAKEKSRALDVAVDEGRLTFPDLLPVWLAVLLGWVASLGGFFTEIVFSRLQLWMESDKNPRYYMKKIWRETQKTCQNLVANISLLIANVFNQR